MSLAGEWVVRQAKHTIFTFNLLIQHCHAIADVIWRSIDNTINVLNIEAMSNNAIHVNTITLTAA